MHGTGLPSDWITRWAHLVAPGGSVLDVACGGGRHLRWFAARGHRVTGVDRNAEALAGLDTLAECVLADIEAHPWPLHDRQFDAVVVTNYLWRPLWPALFASLAPGGLLLYETFASGQETIGRPSRPEFLLQPGELLARCADLRIVGYEDGVLRQPDRFVQRIAAVRPPVVGAEPVRHVLPECAAPQG